MKFIRIFLLILIIIGIGLLLTQKKWVPQVVNYILKIEAPGITGDYKNTEYVVDGKKVRLVNGLSAEEIPGSVAQVVTRYFGNEVRKDLNGDGREDVVFLLTQSMGGSGTFFYVVASLNTDKGYVGSQAIFLGDRIAPQTSENGPGNTVVINYADRGAGEGFGVKPSIGKSIRLLLDTQTMQFGEVVTDFEGEADPSRMTLSMKTWSWLRAEYNDGSIVTPKKAGKFNVTFKKDGSFSATTDCNGVGGEYSTKQSEIVFKNLVSTLMYCDGSQEAEFTKLLQNTTGYHFTSKGELILDLKYDSGSVVFN